ncbi:MAG: glycosyltransferase family 2 protein [Acidobacteriota bacterium]
MRRVASPDVSIVVPMYNEEENVAALCRAVSTALAGWTRSHELILVDDGSRDGTPDLLRHEAETDARVRVILLARNQGQTQAMATGFAASRGHVVVSMDGDLQNDPRDIPALVDRIDSGFDVVCGWRKDRKDSWLSRTLPSKIANWLIARMTGIPIHDNGCSLKAYRAEVIRSLRLYSEMHRFLPALSSMTGARIAEVVVRHHPRIHGVSKYGISRTFKVLSDMVTIKMLTRFANRPGLWFALLAAPALGMATLTGLIALAGAWHPSGATTIVFSSLAIIFFYLSGHLLGLSILSEMLLARSDKTYLRRLVEALAVEERRNISAPAPKGMT